MRLIISEKANTAKKIAQFLSEDSVKEGKHRSVPHHTFTWKGEETVSVGLKGHVLNPEYPEEYSNWQKVEPRALIDAEILKSVSEKGVAQAVTSLAKKADSVVIATDFDREGELIGVEALSLVFEANPNLTDHVQRARFSALTPGEVGRAFDELLEVSNDLADAGEARQDIDLIWGATLTRWVSRATKRYGSAFLSVGRVQSPTLVLIADRERERRAFIPVPYWELEVNLENGEPFTVRHQTERFKDEARANNAYENITDKATVEEVQQKSATRKPPAPFNTTAFLTAASSIGFSPSRAARIAEDLYTDGYISYPRTDNTVYPRSLDLREVLGYLKDVEGAGPYAEKLLQQDELSPTRGKKETTDHPPIYPTGHATKDSMRDDRWKVYQLVVRRFLATLSTQSKSLRTTLRFDSGGEPLVTGGTVVTEEGWLGVYPYSRRADEEIPNLSEGDVVRVVGKEILSKETQPPGRYGAGRLITVMEDFASEIASHEMTAKLERSMDEISEGKISKDSVVDSSREVLRKVYDHLQSSETEFADIVWEGIRTDETLGTCPESGHDLIIRRNRKSRKRFVGCSGYPDCTVTYPLPQRGEIIPLGTTCDTCGAPEIKVLGGKRPWVTCINMDCPKKQEQREAAERAKQQEEGGEGSSAQNAQELQRSTT
jgi:DNA topoisomerase-1